VTSPKHIAVVVSTYNKPEYLRLVLNGYQQQTDNNFVLYIADDGSSEETRKLIEKLSSHFPVPIRHIRHEDRGFRKCRIHNRALLEIQEDYIIFTDGDCVPLPAMVASHRRYAVKGSFLSGGRILLSRTWTDQLCKAGQMPERVQATGWLKHRLHGNINRLLPLILPVSLGRPHARLKGIRGCHLSCWREDVIHVNGFDESFEGWGREDSDLVARLLHACIQRRNLRGLPVFHLWHEEESRHRLDTNDGMLGQCLDTKRTRALKGIDEIPGVNHG